MCEEVNALVLSIQTRAVSLPARGLHYIYESQQAQYHRERKEDT